MLVALPLDNSQKLSLRATIMVDNKKMHMWTPNTLYSNTVNQSKNIYKLILTLPTMENDSYIFKMK